MSKVAQITSQAIQAGAHPAVLSALHSILGTQAYNGLCQKFVEQATQGRTGLYASAIDAWNQQKSKAVPDPNLSGIKPGDAVYFGADSSNGGDGHTGVYTGNGQMISATDNGVRQSNLSDWLHATGQQILGYIPSGNDIQNIGTNVSNMAQNVGKEIGNIGNAGKTLAQDFNFPQVKLPTFPTPTTPTYNPGSSLPTQPPTPWQKQPQQTIASAAFGGSY